MKKSDFQFSNPILTELEFKINKEYLKKESQNIDINVEFSVDVAKDESKPEAVVTLTVITGDDDKPFSIKISEMAKFKWNANVNENVEGLLNQNAPALLLAYIRPIIATITSASPFSTYNLPFVNFTNK